jgi:hypothetical protein
MNATEKNETEYDISAELEKDQVALEKAHPERFKISVLPEPTPSTCDGCGCSDGTVHVRYGVDTGNCGALIGVELCDKCETVRQKGRDESAYESDDGTAHHENDESVSILHSVPIE